MSTDTSLVKSPLTAVGLTAVGDMLPLSHFNEVEKKFRNYEAQLKPFVGRNRIIDGQLNVDLELYLHEHEKAYVITIPKSPIDKVKLPPYAFNENVAMVDRPIIAIPGKFFMGYFQNRDILIFVSDESGESYIQTLDFNQRYCIRVLRSDGVQEDYVLEKMFTFQKVREEVVDD